MLALLTALAGACHSRGLSRDGGPQDSAQTESGRIDAVPFLVDVLAPDTPIPTSDLGAKPDAFIDSNDAGPITDVGPATTDLGMAADLGAGSEAAVPAGCAGQDFYVDVSDGSETWHLVRQVNSVTPLATTSQYGNVVIAVQEDRDGGASLHLEMTMTGLQSAKTLRTVWASSATSKVRNDHCGSNKPVTITRFDAEGGLLEGDFAGLALGDVNTCEVIEKTLSGHFRVCYVPKE
jgi:hypothetical protein